MKTLVDLDAHLLNEIIKVSGARTKRAALTTAMEEYLAAKKREELKKLISSGKLRLSLKKLERLRTGS
jgi:Arc/MetJ family transcription regulator